jgi:hypothetical protein
VIERELRATRAGDPERGTAGAGAEVRDDRVAPGAGPVIELELRATRAGVPNAARRARARGFALIS